MLSTSKLCGFSLSQPKNNERLYKKNKFTSHMISPYDHYKNQLNSNVHQLKRKYPTVQIDYIKSLLEQLDNNIQMVSDIIEEEQRKNEKCQMESQKSQTESLFEDKKEKIQFNKIEDIKVLKSSLVKLFKKLREEQKQKQQLTKKVSVLSRQNQNLKLVNKQLRQEQMEQNSFINNLDIC